MSISLEDAWDWYRSVRELTLAMQTLGAKHWDALPWDGPLGRDNRLRGIGAEEIGEQVRSVLRDLDDLCVLLLFSVFEAEVRDQVLEDTRRELPELRHVALRHAIAEMEESIEQGSFFRVLEPFKELHADLVEQVNQVRRYRNWVAHGRRGQPQAAVDPFVAYDRLRRFLDRLGEAKVV